MVALPTTVFTVLHVLYRRKIEQKDRGIMQQIREQNMLAKELERSKVENQTLERLLNNMLENFMRPPATNKEDK
jgi:hypothetical protein